MSNLLESFVYVRAPGRACGRPGLSVDVLQKISKLRRALDLKINSIESSRPYKGCPVSILVGRGNAVDSCVDHTATRNQIS